MEKTNIKAEFIITGDAFDPNIITRELAIPPTGQYKNGDKVEGRNVIRQECCWFLTVDYEESYDINDQLQKLIKVLENREKKLVDLQNIYSLNFTFSFSIRIENNETPAISIEREVVSFANKIKAEFDFDLYIF
ncbi:DUF4279 domain-containing protein [Paenibacillus sp. UMB4589-SE434]|uniref:DUF4279 domain-containing protein n=1 Tax=Paenibacillus sp. UMB4589-SE434 TaxID=3046314 RepID=UPI00254B866F|nr:DUF4279 domain-containing protein [Paenibacillus sp. UMB4589-SE434]MDK8182627.1 DUF4279 domain-containing protein [Paenibacillus sp. UMB4589-SE434]